MRGKADITNRTMESKRFNRWADT